MKIRGYAIKPSRSDTCITITHYRILFVDMLSYTRNCLPATFRAVSDKAQGVGLIHDEFCAVCSAQGYSEHHFCPSRG
jgi:hypothetical protein